MKISVLSAVGHPFAGFAIDKLSKKIDIDSIIIDKKKFTKKDRNIWNFRTLQKIPLIKLSEIKNIKKFYVDSHTNEETMGIIDKRNLSLLINLGTPRILGRKLLKKTKIGVLNCHPGILPNYRGCTCVEWALFNNDHVGNTCHLMTNKIDEGPIIKIRKLNTIKLNSYQKIRNAMYLDSIKLILESINLLQNYPLNKFSFVTGGKYNKPIPDSKMLEVLKIYGDESGYI